MAVTVRMEAVGTPSWINKSDAIIVPLLGASRNTPGMIGNASFYSQEGIADIGHMPMADMHSILTTLFVYDIYH